MLFFVLKTVKKNYSIVVLGKGKNSWEMLASSVLDDATRGGPNVVKSWFLYACLLIKQNKCAFVKKHQKKPAFSGTTWSGGLVV